jgi:post-segregation antitoxin (ccd killing protein)
MDANTGSGLTYQWQNGNTNISGATNSELSTSVAGSYKVIVTNNIGCIKASALTILNNYLAAQVKIMSIGSLNICTTGSVTLSAKIVSDYSYQWLKDNVTIPGAIGTSYSATQPGTYCYQATTSQGCSTTSTNKVVTSCRLENENNIAFQLSVYPNPTNGNFNIELHLDEELNATARIEVINIMGDVVTTEEAEISEGTLRHTISMKPELPNALYFVKITVGDQIFFQRIIYQR